MKLPAMQERPRAENTVALINVVFLLLIFLILTGTIASQAERAVKLPPSVQGLASQAGEGTLILLADGTLMADGQVADLDSFVSGRDPGAQVHVAADREAPASALVALIADLRKAGFTEVSVLVSRQPGGNAP